MWLCPSLLQTIKNIILITLYLYGKRKKKKTEYWSSVQRSLCNSIIILLSLLSYNVCISWIEWSITLPLGKASISGEQSEYHHTNTILDLNQAATAMQLVSASNENRPRDLHISRINILKGYTRIPAEHIQFLIMTSKQVL